MKNLKKLSILLICLILILPSSFAKGTLATTFPVNIDTSYYTVCTANSIDCYDHIPDLPLNLYPGDWFAVMQTNNFGTFWGEAYYLAVAAPSSLENAGLIANIPVCVWCFPSLNIVSGWSMYNNPNVNTQDQWHETYFNETRSPITLTYEAENNWDSTEVPNTQVIPPCSSYEMPATTFKYTASGSWINLGNNGYLKYYFHGLDDGGAQYNGEVQATANYPDWPTYDAKWKLTGAQSVSGSLDWIGFSSPNTPVCTKGQQYNCIDTFFTNVMNANATPYSGGHGGSARLYATGTGSNANYVSIIFRPRNESDICPLTSAMIDQEITKNFGDNFAKHRERFWALDHNETFAQYWPDWDTKDLVSGGIFVNGLYPITYNVDTKDTTTDAQANNVTAGESGIEYHASNTLVNNSDVTQTLSTTSYSHTMTTTVTSTTTTGYSNQFGGAVSNKVDIQAGIPGVVDGTVEATITVNYNHTWSNSSSNTNSTTDSIQYSAPPQAVIVPPHSTVIVDAYLYSAPVNFDFNFYGTIINSQTLTGSMYGRWITEPDEWLHEELYQAVAPTDIKLTNGDKFETDLYSLFSGMESLPPGITYDPSSNVYNLTGTVSNTTKLGLVFQVIVGPALPNGSGLQKSAKNLPPSKIYYVKPIIKVLKPNAITSKKPAIAGTLRKFW